MARTIKILSAKNKTRSVSKL